MRETVPNNALITFKLFNTKLLTYLLTYLLRITVLAVTALAGKKTLKTEAE